MKEIFHDLGHSGETIEIMQLFVMLIQRSDNIVLALFTDRNEQAKET